MLQLRWDELRGRGPRRASALPSMSSSTAPAPTQAVAVASAPAEPALPPEASAAETD